MIFSNKIAGRKQDGSEKARWWFKSKMALRKQNGSEKARWWFKSKMAVRKQDGMAVRKHDSRLKTREL